LVDKYNLDTTEGMLDRYVYGRYSERCLVSSCVVYGRAPIIVVIIYPVFTDHGRSLSLMSGCVK